jgi:hypothetical protein
MAVVSHRPDIKAESTAFGARVRGDGMDDLIFRDPDGVHYAVGGVRFDGSAGIVRRQEMALFHGSRIAAEGISIETADPDLGISAKLSGDSLAGAFYAPHASSVTIAGKEGTFFVDGARQSMQTLPKGLHRWEIASGMPTPMPPRILRTENSSGAAKVILEPVAGATRYRFFLSRDNAKTWSVAGESATPEIEIIGLANEAKVHIRAIAINSGHQSEPGPEYPVYVTAKPSLPPDGLHLSLTKASTEVRWGEVLGVTAYKLYSRTGADAWRLIYQGRQRTFTDVSRADEYKVSSVNGNGEGVASRIATSDPKSWRNFDPRPGEPFRRTVTGPVYYPK